MAPKNKIMTKKVIVNLRAIAGRDNYSGLSLSVS